MPTLEELVQLQDKNAEDINRAISNIKKTPKERKSVDYYQRRSKELDELWINFERIDNKIRSDPAIKEDNSYFKQELHKIMSQRYREADEELQKNIQSLSKPQSKTLSTKDHQPDDRKMHSLVKTQYTTISNIINTLNDVLESGVQYTREYINAKIRQIEHNINTMQKLQDKICIENIEHNTEEFLMKQTEITDKLMQIEQLGASLAQESKSNNPENDIQHLPKVTIPKFDGDYLKWQPFYDMFSEMIHKKRMPAIQKMWFLKTNVTGEAARLIQNLALTETNYETAWNMLQNRFNNPRILTKNILDKLLTQPKITENPSSAAVKGLHDTTCETISALNNLNINTSTWDPILINILVKKLDQATHMLYEQYIHCPRELPSLEEFLRFLETRFQSLEAIGQNCKSPRKTVSSVTASEVTKKDCKLCNNGNHPLYHCEKFITLSVSDRLKWIQQQQRCVNCFRNGHMAKHCTSSCCRKCSKKHNTLVHLENNSHTQNKTTDLSKQSSTSASGVIKTPAPTTVASVQHLGGRQGYVLLATALVKITANNGASGIFKALLDSGSQINIVTSRVVKRLSIKPSRSSLCIEGIGNQSRKTNHRINVKLQSTTSTFSTRLEAFVLNNIIPPQPSKELNFSSWPIPENIHLADPEFGNTANIDVLLGAEYYLELMTTGSLQLSPELPTLQNTKLGWIISGKIREDSGNSAICAVYSEEEPSTDELIQQFWKLDDFESDDNLTTEERMCETHFAQTTTRNKDGRFVVRLPFSETASCLGDTRGVALSRFTALERRLSRDPQLKSQYIEFMNQYEALGHMTSINECEVQTPHFYIPHHCVLRPESSTTKLRVVFDASAKSASGLSLNDILYTGPTTQGDLFGMLLRFRMPRFVFCTDIEKMYRQILVHPADQNMQLIFWRKNPTEAIATYRLNTVTYGTSAAPYLATKCLQQLAERNMERYPLGAYTLRHDFYVDDGMSGSDSLITAIETQQQLTKLLQEAGFKLRKWCANHSQLLKGIPPEDQEVNLDFDNQSTKVLGLTWTPKSDWFCLKTNIQDNQNLTKRSVTSDVAKIFDPLGIAGPVVVAAKLFIQRLWQLQLTWDDPLPEPINSEWKTFRENLRELNKIRAKRHIFDGQIAQTTQVHTFVDASEKAYGAAVYLRSRLQDGRTIVRLMCAKSRVAPLKKLTLPRLELCAALLGATLTARVKRELNLKINKTFLWSDSEIVLHWINSTSSSLRTFVANRVSKIQELTINLQWRHVSSKQNPADLISRGLSPSKLFQCSLWFYGPMFLHGKEDQWPTEFQKGLQLPGDLEVKQRAVTSAPVTSAGIEEMIYNINNRNSFIILQRIVAYIQRFIRNCRLLRTDRPQFKTLSPQELTAAKILIVKTIQTADFKDEISTLKKNKEIDKASNISSLSPFLDENNILRVGGRLEASSLPYDAKHPILLPYNDSISKLILTMFHQENHHCGPQSLLAIARQQYWIIKGKSMARNVVQNCIRCTRAKPRLLNQIMGELPASRVTPARPFIKTGVDYCGPFWVHYKVRGKKPHKVYIAVFVCFSTKAVHLEVATDLTTEAFIGALKRFLSRRGRCQTIYSDNATNFVGARNQLDELKEAIFANTSQEKIMQSCSKDGIEFKFIPPRAPHFGGLWEAAVKSAKQLLLRTVSTASLTHEELETVVIEIEAILNSRPLTPMSTNPNDLCALTPGHFLIGEPLTAQVDSRAQQPNSSLISRWNLVSQLKHEFWRRWSTEYLQQLQEKRKWKSSSENVKEGQMVIIKEDNLPVMRWPLGRILQTHEGNDGRVRVVDIKTTSGTITRPIHRIAPLLHEDELPAKKQNLSGQGQDGEENNSVPRKRRRIDQPILLSILITLMLIPVVLSTNIQLKGFQSDPGLYFEGIGTARMITAEWKLMIYYNLGPLASEINAFSSGILALQTLCSEYQPKHMCNVLIENFEKIKDELCQEQEVFSVSRSKRAAFNIVGNIARSLFGVLDSDYAEEMSININKAKIEKEHILQLLKNQTSIIDSTINIIKQNEVETLERLNNLSDQINQQRNEINKESQQISKIQLMALLLTQLTLLATNLKRTEAELISVLTDTHHGKISPLLLSPPQLKNELTTIRAHLPAYRTLPIDDDNLIQIYKLMNAKGAVTKNKIIFEVKMPLVDQQVLNLFKVTPVPTVKNGSLITILPDSSYLAVNSHRDQFISLTTEDINNCVKANPDVHLCERKQPILARDSDTNSCEINMFSNKSTNNCKLAQIAGNSAWAQLLNKNKWIYTIIRASEMSAVCGTETTQFTLRGSGIMQLEPNCVIKGDGTTIQGHFEVTNNIHASYANFKQFELISTVEERNRVFKTTNHQFKAQLDELNSLQNQLRESTFVHIPEVINSNSQHHHAVSYSALLLSIILLLIVLTLRLYSRCHSPTEKKPAPISVDIIDT